jgi:hypothetical protein
VVVPTGVEADVVTVNVELPEPLLERAEERQRREHRLPENAGKPWSDDEDRLLIEHFDAATPMKELAQRHNRTAGAIQARLEKLGKLPSATRRFA